MNECCARGEWVDNVDVVLNKHVVDADGVERFNNMYHDLFPNLYTCGETLPTPTFWSFSTPPNH